MGYKTDKEGWWETNEGVEFLKKRLIDPEIDRKVDEKLLKSVKGRCILDSWTMPWLLNKGFKVWLESSEEVRVQRVSKRDNLSKEETRKFLREKEAKTKALYKNLYGFSLGEDFAPFHLILDVNILNQNEVFEVLRDVINKTVIEKLFLENNLIKD
jgi:cytidylate kinase